VEPTRLSTLAHIEPGSCPYDILELTDIASVVRETPAAGSLTSDLRDYGRHERTATAGRLLGLGR